MQVVGVCLHYIETIVQYAVDFSVLILPLYVVKKGDTRQKLTQ